MDTSGSTSYQNALQASGDCGSYTSDPNACQDLKNGQATINSTYSGANGDLTGMSASCSGILSGLAVLNDPNASAGDKIKAIATVDAGILGAISIGTSLGVELGLISAEVAVTTIPVVGAVIIGVVALIGAIMTLFDISFPGAAKGQPISFSSKDLAYQFIAQIWTNIPLVPPKGAVFTDQSRTLAALLASYVQAQRAAAGLPTLAMLSTPTGGQFGYQSKAADTIHSTITTGIFGGNPALAAQVESVVSPLWDPRWPSDAVGYDIMQSGGYEVLGTGDEIDPQNPQAIPIKATDPLTHVTLSTATDHKGLSAASRLIELAAALFLGNASNAAGITYAMVFLHLSQVAWIYKTTNPTGDPNTAVPNELYAAAGFMLECAVDNSIPRLNLIPGSAKTAVKPVGSAAFSALHLEGNSPIDVWVSYYLSRANEAPAS